jgi:hypothetical protein
MYEVVLLFVKIATAAAAAALVCLFVMLFVVTDCSLLSLRLACVWLIRHGTADNDGHGDDATRLRAFGGACWAVLADVHLGARRRCVRVWILPLGWRVFGCWTACLEPRVGGGGVRVVAGRVGAGGWAGG